MASAPPQEVKPIDPVQRLLAIAERERRKSSPAPAGTSAKRQPPPASSEEDSAWRHQRLQQALVEAVRAGREPDREGRKELVWFARLGMSEAEALSYLLRKYPVSGSGGGTG